MNDPDKASVPPLFKVSNRHGAGCREAPAFDGDERGAYHGYFQNELGEQFVFVSDRRGGDAVLSAGDVGWDRTFRVVEGEVWGLVLGEAEAAWVRACWLVTRTLRGRAERL